MSIRYKFILSGCVVGLLFSLPAAYAQVIQKPGLWEQWIKSSNMSANLQMPTMSPQQAEQLRKMGIPVPDFRDGGMVSKVCFTAQQVKNLQTIPYEMQGQMNCKVLNSSKSGNKTMFESSCDSPMGKLYSRSVFEAQSSDQYTMRSDTEVQQGGQSKQYTTEVKATWLGPDCGSVKSVMGF